MERKMSNKNTGKTGTSTIVQGLKAKGYRIFVSGNTFFNETFDLIASSPHDNSIMYLKFLSFKILLPNINRIIKNIASSVDHLDKLKDFKFFIISLGGFSSGALLKAKKCGFPLFITTIDRFETHLSEG